MSTFLIRAETWAAEKPVDWQRQARPEGLVNTSHLCQSLWACPPHGDMLEANQINSHDLIVFFKLNTCSCSIYSVTLNVLLELANLSSKI